jgi:hypothetical protein
MNYMFIFIIILLLIVGYAIGQPSSSVAASSALPSKSAVNSLTTQASVNQTGIDMYNSDSSLTGSPITNDPSTWPGDDPIWNICCAVALAEGYNLGNGSAPYDLNNPGDLSPGDEAGQATCGGAQQHGGSAIILFCTAENGWKALYVKFLNITNGVSQVYPSSYTWTQVAAKYAGNAQNWLNNVTSYLGVDPTSTPLQYVQSQTGASS